jgi:hypothetical protein
VSAARERVLAVGGVAFGAMWLFAAVAKTMRPVAAFELVSRATPPGVSPKLVVAGAVAAEAFLGAAMCMRAVKSLRWSLAGLAVATAALLSMRIQVGPKFHCGCFGTTLGATVDEALLRNAVLVVIHVGLIVWARTKAQPVVGGVAPGRPR